MARSHPVRGEDFDHFDDSADLEEFAPSVRVIGRDRDSGAIEARYEYYAAGPRAAHEAFVDSARSIVDVLASELDVTEFGEKARQYEWSVEIMTPTNSVPYLYDLAGRVAELDEDLSMLDVLLLWSKHDRTLTCDDQRIRYYTTPSEALWLALHGKEANGTAEVLPITELVPEYQRSNPAVTTSDIPSLGYEDYRLDIEIPPHYEVDDCGNDGVPL